MSAKKLLFVGLALGLVALVQAQQSSPATPVLPAPVSAPALNEDVTAPKGPYRLQVGDVILVDVRTATGNLAFNATPEVDTRGDIAVPILGLVHAQGRTISELFSELSDRYHQRLQRQPGEVFLTVSPVRIRQMRASILGRVARPGNYDFREGDRVSSLLANAQGTLTDGTADIRHATLRRARTGEVIPLDLYSLLTHSDQTQDYVLEDGDVISVPEETRNRIVVTGEVKQPVVIPYAEGLSVAQAVVRAGDRTDLSRMTRVTIIRPRPGRPDDPDYITVDLVKYYKGIDRTQNIELKPGDTVFVPSNGNPNLSILNSYFNVFYLFRSLGFNPFSF